MKALSKHLKASLPHQSILDKAKDARSALEKLDDKVSPIARFHKEIGGSKSYDYHESGRGGFSCYSILDGLWHSGL